MMEKYLSTELISVQRKKLYTDNEGYPNENAFRDFVSAITEADNYHLLCMSIDLSVSNKKSYAIGDRVMRTVFLKLMDYFNVFRVSGDKFNILYQDKDKGSLDSFLTHDNSSLFSVYYGKVEDIPITSETIAEARRKGIEAMYADKGIKTNKRAKGIREDKIVGDKGNIPVELQETSTHKFRETMWYGVIKVNEIEPVAKDFTLYVFPTEFKPPMATLNTVIVVEDILDVRAYVGSGVHFGIDGMRFNVYTRFDKEGHLSITIMKDSDTQGKYETEIQCFEGCGIPVSFGKRVGEEKEIFPYKRNIYGTQEYVLWDGKNNTVNINRTGMFDKNDKHYSVYADETGIDLVENS